MQFTASIQLTNIRTAKVIKAAIFILALSSTFRLEMIPKVTRSVSFIKNHQLSTANQHDTDILSIHFLSKNILTIDKLWKDHEDHFRAEISHRTLLSWNKVLNWKKLSSGCWPMASGLLCWL